MFEKLEDLEKKFLEISEKVNDPDIISKQDIWRNLMKEQSVLSDIVMKFREYKNVRNNIQESKDMLNENLDSEFKDLVKEELKQNEEDLKIISEDLKILLLPKDPNDDKNVIVEIRGGAGGNEANLFAGDLFRMYARYAERHRWKSEIINANISDLGGYKDVSFLIKGHGAYSRLKYEMGVHRVQRIPTTESGGRIHTSTVTVAILPEVEEVDVDLNMNDIRTDVFRASGAGGQHVNMTDSAVRMTHIPTGIVVSCQDGKSQIKNKEQALRVLIAKLYDFEYEKQHSEISAERKSQVGTGDRSERIRTYNFPQGRVTDHRINLTIHRIDDVLDGDLDELMDTLITTAQAENLKSIDSV